jgi:hypothetical protein
VAIRHRHFPPCWETPCQMVTAWAPNTNGRQPWSKQKMTKAVEHRPHKLALSQDALQHFAKKAAEKVAVGQATVVNWDSIKDNPPIHLKFSPVAEIPHKLRGLRPILAAYQNVSCFSILLLKIGLILCFGKS